MRVLLALVFWVIVCLLACCAGDEKTIWCIEDGNSCWLEKQECEGSIVSPKQECIPLNKVTEDGLKGDYVWCHEWKYDYDFAIDRECMSTRKACEEDIHRRGKNVVVLKPCFKVGE